MTLIKSMTGYGRAVQTVNGREFTVEVRSVNNRYLDCSVKLPRMVSFAEDAVKQAVKNAISRGKVDVFITVRSEAGDEVQVTLNESVLRSYLAAMHQMVDEFGVADDISVSAVSRLPEVFIIEKPQVDEEQLMADLMSVVAKALQGYDAMRCTEGEALDRDLRSRGETILTLVSQVEEGNGKTKLYTAPYVKWVVALDGNVRLEAQLPAKPFGERIEVFAHVHCDKGLIGKKLCRYFFRLGKGVIPVHRKGDGFTDQLLAEHSLFAHIVSGYYKVEAVEIRLHTVAHHDIHLGIFSSEFFHRLHCYSAVGVDCNAKASLIGVVHNLCPCILYKGHCRKNTVIEAFAAGI
jgi:hypothetical protein